MERPVSWKICGFVADRKHNSLWATWCAEPGHMKWTKIRISQTRVHNPYFIHFLDIAQKKWSTYFLVLHRVSNCILHNFMNYMDILSTGLRGLFKHGICRFLNTIREFNLKVFDDYLRMALGGFWSYLTILRFWRLSKNVISRRLETV